MLRRLAECDWLVHNFGDDNHGNICNPAGYLYGQELEGASYRACVDLNVFQYVVNSVKKRALSEDYHNACSVLIFCRYANIDIDPALSLYEWINYGSGSIEEALDELVLFRALDNSDPDTLAEYVIGNPNALRGLEMPEINRAELRQGLTRHKRLIDWDSIYVLVSGAVVIFRDGNISAPRKLEAFLDWMIKDFRISLAVLVCAIRLFGSMPLSKIMKFKSRSSRVERKQALVNMTWDLFLIDHYFKSWTNPQKHWEEILFTQDRVVKELLRMAICVQYAGTIDPLFKYLSERQVSRCKGVLDGASKRCDRMYLKEEWTPEYRRGLIIDLERRLGVEGVV